MEISFCSFPMISRKYEWIYPSLSLETSSQVSTESLGFCDMFIFLIKCLIKIYEIQGGICRKDKKTFFSILNVGCRLHFPSHCLQDFGISHRSATYEKRSRWKITLKDHAEHTRGSTDACHACGLPTCTSASSASTSLVKTWRTSSIITCIYALGEAFCDGVYIHLRVISKKGAILLLLLFRWTRTETR